MLRSTMVMEYVGGRFDQRTGYGYESRSRSRR